MVILGWASLLRLAQGSHTPGGEERLVSLASAFWRKQASFPSVDVVYVRHPSLLPISERDGRAGPGPRVSGRV